MILLTKWYYGIQICFVNADVIASGFHSTPTQSTKDATPNFSEQTQLSGLVTRNTPTHLFCPTGRMLIRNDANIDPLLGNLNTI